MSKTPMTLFVSQWFTHTTDDMDIEREPRKLPAGVSTTRVKDNPAMIQNSV